MKKILAQCKKELAQFVRDRLTVALAFVLPSLSLFLFGFGVRLEIQDVPLVVQNFDNGYLSADLIDRIYRNAQFIAHDWSGSEPWTGALDRGYAKAAIIIPPDFSRRLENKTGARFQVFIDATDVNNARVIKNSIIGTTRGFMQANHLIPSKEPIKGEIRLWFNPGRKESLYVVPGAIGLCLWIFPSLLASLAMVREKESGTVLQVYASSITAFELIAGKVCAYTIVALAETTVLDLLSIIFFQIKLLGDPTPYLVGTLFFVTSAVCFGTFVGTRTNSQSAAVQAVATGGFTTALLLSGYLYPIRNIVYPLSYITVLVPNRWYIELSRNAFIRGGDWFYDWVFVLFLLMGATFFFSLSVKLMSRMQLKA